MRVEAVKANILVVDDDPKVTAMLKRAFTYEGLNVEATNDGRSALRIAESYHPDLVVLDVMMPDMDGLEVCRRLRGSRDIPILMLTARDAIADRVAGLETGADDYLIKPFAFEELLARVRALLRRRLPEGREVLRSGDVTLDTSARAVTRGTRPIELSTTEFQLLALFVRRPGHVLTRDLIMERIWGFDFEGESNVLEAYISYLRSKLEAAGEKRILHTVRGTGYVLKE